MQLRAWRDSKNKMGVGMSEDMDLHDGAEVNEPAENEELPSSALVEIDNGLAVFFGDKVPEGLDLVPFAFLDPGTRAAVSTAVGSAVGFGNMAAQGVNAAMQAQGLVRLAPQTLEALKTATPMVKDGWNLGTLASGGKFAAQVRWLPASAATTASVVASMGPAISLMMIQFQLNQIADVAQHNLELTSKVLQVVRQEQWSAVTGHHNTLIRELAMARQIGEVTEAIFGEVRGYQGELTSQWDANEKAVRRYGDELRGKLAHKERQQYLTDNGQAIIADVQALLLAQTSWFVYQALRASYLAKSAKTNEQDAELLDAVIANAQQLHEEALVSTEWLLDQLAREFAVIAELPGRRTFKIGGEAKAAKEAHHMVRQLQDALASIRAQGVTYERTGLLMPSILVFEGDVPEELTRILPWRLEAGERVLALADASYDRITLPRFSDGWVVVTDRRILITKQDSLRRVGAIDIEVNVADIRYVRRPDTASKPPLLDIITKDSDLTLRFAPWSRAGAPREQAQRFSELVASFMNLPRAEVPEVDTAAIAPLAPETAPELERLKSAI
jgi:hypothetical protein